MWSHRFRLLDFRRSNLNHHYFRADNHGLEIRYQWSTPGEGAGFGQKRLCSKASLIWDSCRLRSSRKLLRKRMFSMLKDYQTWLDVYLLASYIFLIIPAVETLFLKALAVENHWGSAEQLNKFTKSRKPAKKCFFFLRGCRSKSITGTMARFLVDQYPNRSSFNGFCSGFLFEEVRNTRKPCFWPVLVFGSSSSMFIFKVNRYVLVADLL